MSKQDFISVEGRQRLERVAQWLEAGAPHITLDDNGVVREFEGFNMGNTVTCGSACCIAGAVCQFDKPYSVQDFIDIVGNHTYGNMEFFADPKNGDKHQGVMPRAVELLGISEEDALALFIPEETGLDLDLINDPYLGARVIRTYLETGEITWAQEIQASGLLEEDDE